MLGLYLHIPFCGAICHYCNFNRGLLDAGLKARYVDALDTEIRRAADGSVADTIYFGGGTPSLLAPDEVARLIAACRESFAVTSDAEVTLELNPETATPDYLAAIRAAGGWCSTSSAASMSSPRASSPVSAMPASWWTAAAWSMNSD